MHVKAQTAVRIPADKCWLESMIAIEESDKEPFVVVNKPYRVLEEIVKRSILCVTGQIQINGKAVKPEDYVADWRTRLDAADSTENGASKCGKWIAEVTFDTQSKNGKWYWSALERDNPDLVGKITADEDGVIRKALDLGNVNDLEMFGWLVKDWGTFTLKRKGLKSSALAATGIPELLVDDEQLTLF